MDTFLPCPYMAGIIGDLITVPLYFYKGLTISSLQYIIFTVLALLGYISWKKILLKTNHQ